MIGKAGLLKCIASALLVAFAIGEAGAVSTAPINPAFLRWKKHDNKLRLPDKLVNRPRLMTVNSTEPMVEHPLGEMPNLFDSTYLSTLNFNVNRGVADALPVSYDLRKTGELTPVRDQGSYSTCWAHASCSSLESWLLRTTGQSFDFSENNLANLHGFDWGFDDGGNASLSQAYFLRWSGPVLESEDIYPNPGGSVEKPPALHVQRVRWIPGRIMYLDNDAIKAAVQKYGALHVNYYHNFDSSCYNSSKAAYYFYISNPQRLTNHAVALVGWDDNYSKDNFIVTPPGNGAFIVRNNWGSSWGEAGYFYVSYYDESFAWNQLYAFTDAEPSDNYDGIYQYDQLGLISSIGYNSTTAWGASLFTSIDGLPVAAVGFYALVPSTSYTIQIYVGCSKGNPISGTLALEQTGKTDELGYWTIPLSKSVAVSKGQHFAVVLKLATPGYNYPLAFEYAYAGFSSAATANAGETFLSGNGTSWSDFTDVNGTASFCCKAYTKSSTAPAKTLSAIVITGVNSLQSGKIVQFTCKAKYSDGSDADVSKMASWSIVSGLAYASVDSTGLVTAKSVTQQQTVKVHVEYTEGGITKGDDWSFYVTVAPPEPPTNLSASQGTDALCVRVTWTAPAGASSYSVYRSTTNNSSNAKYLQDVTVPKFNDNVAEPGVKYYYFVKAKNDSGTSGFSTGAQGWKALSAPEGVTASDGTSLEYVEVAWTAAPGAKYYHVYRSDDLDGEKMPLGSWQMETTYRDATATPGQVYFYYVTSAIDSRGNMASDYSIFDDGYVGVPVTLDFLTIDGAVTIVSGGNETYSCTATYTDKSIRPVARPSWSIISGGDYATIDSSGKVTAKTVAANQAVTLQASYTDGVNRTTTKEITIIATAPSAPSSVTLKSVTTEAVTITWSPVVGASNYSVWRGTSTADAKKIVDVGMATEYADDKGLPGVSQTYWVKASNAAGESDFSTLSVTATRELAAPTGIVATDGTYTDKTLVSWKSVTGATYYRVARAESATGSKTELGSWQTATSYEDKLGTAGKHYWYFVKSSMNNSGANMSAYSAGDEGWRKVSVVLSSIEIGGATKLVAGGSTVLSCTAKYSDNSTKTVKPEWSVSPTTAATIDADGKLTAKGVSENVTATVTARFTDGTTKTDTHEVAIVVPIVATAEVKNVQAKPRWPFSSLLDVDFELVTQPAGTRALVTLSGHDDDKDVAMAARTLTGDGANGSVAAGSHRLTWDVAADYPDFHAKAFSVEMSAVPMSANMPSNVTASAGTSTAGVDITWAAIDDAMGYEVWRNTSSVTNEAERIQTTDQVAYTDTDAAAGTTYWYWVRSVTEEGVSDFGQAVSGWRGYMDITVTFNPNGGSVNPTSKPYSPTKVYGSLPTATRTGYEFDGWYTASSGGTKVMTTSIVPTANTTLWAHWTAHTYTINFNANGGSGSMSDLPMTYDMAKNLTANAFTKSGTNFKGWAMSAGGSVAYADGTSVKNLTADNGVTVTLFAVWEAPVESLAEAVDNAALIITTGGDANWIVDTTTGYMGGASAKSGEIGDNQSSWMQTTIVGPGTFSFRWKVSCEEAYDSLTWTLDGILQGEISGETGWTQVTKDLAAGNHTIRWTYTKDESSGDGSDCGWVDAIVTPLLPPTNVTAGDGTVTASVKITWTAATGATSYTIWRAESNDSSQATEIGTATTASYTDKTGTPGLLYYYWVKATDGTRTSVFSASDTGYRALSAPTSVAASDNTLALGIRVTWDAVEGADGYAIYRGTSSDSGSVTQVGTSMGPVYVDSDIVSDTTSYYFIKATRGSVASAFSTYDKGSRKAGEPFYVVIDLSGGTSAGEYPICEELTSVPSDGWSDTYKTTKLVLRRIANGSFMIGSPLDEIGREGEETQHQVTISKPFFMGIFEVTQKQYELVMGNKPSYFSNSSCYETRPVECVSYDIIRGNSEGAKWPEVNTVDATSFLGKIRVRTGLTFDLPTEAQWEYACRAGTITALNSGKNLTDSIRDSNMDEVGRYNSDLTEGTAAVGSYKANNWGVYDMHGNVAELCLDYWYWWSYGTLPVTDPKGPASGSLRVSRGGGWHSEAMCCRSAQRTNTHSFDETDPATGFRLCCPAGLAMDQVTVSFNANGGSGTMPSVTTGVGGSFAIPVVAFTRTGYTFAGWTTSTSSDVVYADGATIASMTANMTLVANWTANTYAVTLNVNDGICTSLTSYTYGIGATLPTPTRTGYTFGGWYTSSSFSGSVVTEISTTDTGAKTFYAKWTANTYVVTLNVNDGTCTSLTSYIYGIGATLPTPTRTGYTFGGWYTNSSFSGSAVTAISTTDTGVKTFYAKWTRITYTVSFNANGGSGTMDSVSVNYGESIVSECTYWRSGYAFVGWATNSSGSVTYESGSTISDITSAKTLYAKWATPSKTYLVVDLTVGSVASGYPMSELSAVPSGGWTDEYKTNKLVLRRIVNGVFTMGRRLTDYPGASDYKLHQVTISKPFYMGVFEVTKKQYRLITGGDGSVASDMRPVDWVSFKSIRGDSEGVKWPSTNSVDSMSFMGKIRAKTGLTFDLPTEAQWEYACRAGTTTALNSGKNLTSEMQDSAMDEVGCYSYNNKVNKGGNTEGTKNVGSYQPNNWGLYDMHGNVWEWCLDWSDWLDETDVTDPRGPSRTSQGFRVFRGGDWKTVARDCCSASRRDGPWQTLSGGTDYVGFRLCCPAGLATDQVTVSFNANGGSGTMPSVTTGVGGSFAIPVVAFTRDGYRFAGWATSDSGSIVYGDKATISLVSADMMLYACWERLYDLMPLKNLMTVIDYCGKHDGNITEDEIQLVMANSTVADIDGNTKEHSDEEMMIYERLWNLFKNNPGLCNQVFKSNYSEISYDIMEELQWISDQIKRLMPKT